MLAAHGELVLVIDGHCGLQVMCLVHQMMPIQAINFNQYEGFILKLVFIFCDYVLSLEEQEESEETENPIYMRHLEAILQSIPLEKGLDHLLAS